MQEDHQKPRLAWAKLNAYGIILAALCVMGVADLIHPGKANLARLVGDVPPGQPIWVTGYVVAGILLLVGFARTDRLAETLGLVVLTVALIMQTIVAFGLLGISDFTLTRVLVIAVVALGSFARCSVLWSRHGLTIRIPPRGER